MTARLHLLMRLTTFGVLAFGAALDAAGQTPTPTAAEPASVKPLLTDPDEVAAQLPKVRRIFVDKLTGGEAADQLRDILMATLQTARLWVITENPDRADAFIRGAADDAVFNETRESRDGINARAFLGTREGDYSSRAGRGNRSDTLASVGIGQTEAQRTMERKHEATASIRLVNRDGDLIWSTTKESSGAKFKGSAADVADKVVRQLVTDVEAARRPGVRAVAPAGALP
ncbi:MAG: hypothetical protein NTV70_13030 [Acidobacteria bacterium]|nr:hypothetical protein [Acidobacteriota bacterium]